MNFKFIWNEKQDIKEVDIISNPSNKERLLSMSVFHKETASITVKALTGERSRQLALNTIESITAFGHLSKVKTIDGHEYFLQKKLKELTTWEQQGFYRINNSMILNLETTQSFAAGQNARLQVYTHSQRNYDVSRYYAKTIKERLL